MAEGMPLTVLRRVYFVAVVDVGVSSIESRDEAAGDNDFLHAILMRLAQEVQAAFSRRLYVHISTNSEWKVLAQSPTSISPAASTLPGKEAAT